MVEGRAEATALQIVCPVATRSYDVELLERVSDKSVKRVLPEDGRQAWRRLMLSAYLRTPLTLSRSTPTHALPSHRPASPTSARLELTYRGCARSSC